TQIQDISDSKQLEEELRESERRYRSLFEQNNDAVFILSLDGDYIDVNQSGCELLGSSREDILSQGWQTRVVGSEHQHRDSIHKQLMNGERPKLYERTLVRGDGSEVTVEVTVSLVHDEQGTPRYIQSIARDISERKQAEMKIREIEKRKDLALEGGNLGVWSWTKETGEMIFDQRWYHILGYEEGDIETHVNGWAKLVHPDDIEAEYEQWNAHVEGKTPGYSSEHRMKTKSGNWKWVLEKGRIVDRTEDGLTKRAAGTLQDITERKTYEIALQENEERYRALFDQSNDAVFILTLDGRILECNQIAAKYLGYSKDEIIGLSVYALIDPEESEDAQKRAEEVKDIGITQLYERTFIRKDGSSISFEINISLVRDPDGKSLFLQSIARDITERKISEQALREREIELRYSKDRAMLYLDLLGHDITNQLQAISAGSEIAKELSSQKEVKKVLDIVAQSTKRCERIIRTVKATEHLMLKQMKEIKLTELVKHVVTSVEERFPEVEFKISFPEKEFIVTADEYLKVVITNLLENAIQHNPAANKQVWLQVVEQPAGYAVKISDDGMGISDGVKEALFDIKQRFGGVGLHQSKEIMDKYGGCITVSDRVEHQPRQGALFKIWLPKIILKK
ncbi:MAG: PAS domain S-box protein, partial [Candidatus Thorarchaeota archaeon]